MPRRSLKSKLVSAWTWALATPALSAVLPGDQSVTTHGPQPLGAQLDIQDGYAQAVFKVPCVGCLGSDDPSHDDESLLLSLRASAAEEPCGDSSNITLNGITVPQKWADNRLAYGAGSFPSRSDLVTAGYSNQNIDFEWESACLFPQQDNTLKDAAQVLTVFIKGIDGKRLDNDVGFTISFKQQTSPPELLRLQNSPNPLASHESQAESWRSPAAHLRLAATASEPDNSSSESSLEASVHSTLPESPLEKDLRELEELHAKAREIQKAIEEKRQQIEAQLGAASQQELRDCETIKCAIKVVVKEVLRPWRLSGHQSQSTMGRPDDPNVAVWRADARPEVRVKVDTVHADNHDPPPYEAAEANKEPTHTIVLKILLGVFCCSGLVTVNVIQRRRRNTRSKPTSPSQGYPYSSRPRNPLRALFRRRNWRDQALIDDYEEKHSLINHQESILETTMQEEIAHLRSAHGLVNSILQAEEGRLPPARPVSLEHSCPCRFARQQRRYLHHAHDDYAAPPSPTSSTFTTSSVLDLSSRPLSRTSSLPGYHSDVSTAPPAYESDADSEADSDVSGPVQNGYARPGYTVPSSVSGESGYTQDSSIIDVSPRLSADTLRFSERAASIAETLGSARY